MDKWKTPRLWDICDFADCRNGLHQFFLKSFKFCHINHSTTLFTVPFLSKLSTQKYVNVMLSGVSLTYPIITYTIDLICQQYRQHVFDLSHKKDPIPLENVLLLTFFILSLNARNPVQKNWQAYQTLDLFLCYHDLKDNREMYKLTMVLFFYQSKVLRLSVHKKWSFPA